MTLDTSNNLYRFSDGNVEKDQIYVLSFNNNNIKEAVDSYDDDSDKSRYLNKDKINDWNVSNVTDMSGLFENFPYNKNWNLSSWDVSNVTNMSGMFKNSQLLYNHFLSNNIISNWNVSNVIDMSEMFYQAKFNQPLDKWNVSNVTNMSGMFREADKFNQSLNNWNVSNVTDMSGMFHQATDFIQPLDNWDVSNVTNMSKMFYQALEFNQPLDNWDVSNVTNMSGMFTETEKFNQPLDKWNVSNVTNMSGMFELSKKFNQNLNNWDVSNVISFEKMFFIAFEFNKYLYKWKFRDNFVIFDYMFRYSKLEYELIEGISKYDYSIWGTKFGNNIKISSFKMFETSGYYKYNFNMSYKPIKRNILDKIVTGEIDINSNVTYNFDEDIESKFLNIINKDSWYQNNYNYNPYSLKFNLE